MGCFCIKKVLVCFKHNNICKDTSVFLCYNEGTERR